MRSKKRLALALLRQARRDRRAGVTTAEFIDAGCGSRFGGRLDELLHDGHVIASAKRSISSWIYTLTYDAERDIGRPEQQQHQQHHIAASSRLSRSGRSDVSLGAGAPPTAPTPGAERPANPGELPPASPGACTSPVAPSPPLFDPGETRPGEGGYRDHDSEDAAA